MVVVMDEALRQGASGVAQRLRRAGRSVDLVLEAKKMKWVFRVGVPALCAHRLNRHGVVMVSAFQVLSGEALSRVELACRDGSAHECHRLRLWIP